MKIIAGNYYSQGNGRVYVSRLTKNKVVYHPVLTRGVCFHIEWKRSIPKFEKECKA